MLVVAALRLHDLAPWRSFTIDTPWSVAVTATELGKHIGPGCTFRPALLAHTRSETEFTFCRRIGYRNSFLPVIKITIAAGSHHGARLTVRMRLNWLVSAFMGFWVTFATLGSVGVAVASIAESSPLGCVAVLMPLVGVALTGGGFAFEARRAEQLLRDIFPPAPLPPAGPYR